MSMTPERTFKLLTGSKLIVGQNTLGLRMIEDGEHVEFPVDAADVFDDVLAALEESQQHIEIADKNARAAINLHMEKELAALQLSNDLSGLLAEAQQTIARQREALEFLADDSNWSWWNVGTEDKTVTWVGGTDPQHAAREALGNKEGSDKA